jgi:hypothetical protein
VVVAPAVLVAGAVVGAAVVGAEVVGATVVGAAVVGAAVVGTTVVAGRVVGGRVVGGRVGWAGAWVTVVGWATAPGVPARRTASATPIRADRTATGVWRRYGIRWD